MHPTFFGVLPAYVVGWTLAGVLGGAATAWLLRRAGVGAGRAAGVIGISVALFFLGSKGLFLIENWPAWWLGEHPLAVILDQQMRLPGGFMLLGAMSPLVARVAGLPVLRHCDLLVPATGLTIVGVRTGCFLRGCCHGTPSDHWWALEFPAHGLSWWWQAERGLIPFTSAASFPVHPLQLYFAAVGLLLFAGGVLYQRYKRYDGEVLLAFLLVYCWSTWALEFLRADVHEFVHQLAGLAALAITAIAVIQEWQQRARRRLPTTA